MPIKKNDKLNILFITEFLPWPLNSGGRIRSYNILQEASKRHIVTLIANDYDDVKDKFQNKVSKLHIVNSQKKPKILKILMAFFALFSKKPYLSAFIHYQRRMAQKIQQITKEEKFDIVHLDHLDAAIYLKDCGNQPTYLDEHNYESGLLKSVIQSTSNFAIRYFFKNQYKKLKYFEKHVLNSVHYIGTVSKNDANLIRETAPCAKIYVIPNGVDLTYFDGIRQPTSSRLLSIGSLDWTPNVKGLIWFLDHVWPLIHNRFPALEFQIVGRNPPKILLQRINDKINIFANVPDVRKYMRHASVFVVPLFAGGGTRLKVLEAMAMRIPIVATPVGVEGITCTNTKDVLIAESAKEFAEKISLILNCPNSTLNMSNTARKLVEQKYAWSVIGELLNNTYDSIVSNSL